MFFVCFGQCKTGGNRVYYTYEYRLEIGTVILTKNRKQHASQGDGASTAEAAPGRVGRGEQGKARRANSTPNGGPHLELARVRLKNLVSK